MVYNLWVSLHSLTHTCDLILKGVNNGCLTRIPHLAGERKGGKKCWMRWKQTYDMGRDPWLWWIHTQILCWFLVKHATLSGMYLWVEEWARVEELWDLEDCRLPGKGASSPCLMTLSVAGTFLEIYCDWERKKRALLLPTEDTTSQPITFIKKSDVHLPWVSPQDLGLGDWVHWPGFGWDDPHKGSASDDCASSSSVSWGGGYSEAVSLSQTSAQNHNHHVTFKSSLCCNAAAGFNAHFKLSSIYLFTV